MKWSFQVYIGPPEFRPITSNDRYGPTGNGFNPVIGKESLSLQPPPDIVEENCQFSQL